MPEPDSPSATTLAEPATVPATAVRRVPLMVLAVGAAAAFAAAAARPAAAQAAAGRVWPPFALVTGLLLIGSVAAEDGLFRSFGARLARIPGPPAVLLAGLFGLVVIVTVVLNLDTSVVFLTPIMIEAARRRGAPQEAFLYGAVFMSNAASLLLPGSNLTNLLVLGGGASSGLAFARGMIAPWGVAVSLTAIALGVRYRRDLTGHRDRSGGPAPHGIGLGLVATVAAGALVLAFPDPALPVLGLGLSVIAGRVARGRLKPAAVATTVNPALLAGILGVAVGLGDAGSGVGPAPEATLAPAGLWQSAGLGALGAVAVNNLPAAVLLKAWAPSHVRALLLGLNLGPNLAMTGSLSAMLWWQAARSAGARPSPATYSRIGLVVVPLSLAAATAALAITP